MTRKTKAIRLGVLLAILGGLGVYAAASTLKRQNLEAELAELAQGNAHEIQEQFFTEGMRLVATEVTAARTYGVFGDLAGKVSVYVAVRTAPEKEAYYGIDYFYKRSGDKWEFTESGCCADWEAAEKAKELDEKNRPV